MGRGHVVGRIEAEGGAGESERFQLDLVQAFGSVALAQFAVQELGHGAERIA
eukprot:ctg_7125.g469